MRIFPRSRPTLFVALAMVAVFVFIAFGQPVQVLRRLRDLLDVHLSTPPSDGQALVYKTAINGWTNGAPTGGGNTNISVLVSVDGTNVPFYFNLKSGTNYALSYDGGSNVTIRLTIDQVNTWYSILQVTQFYTFEFYSSNVYITNVTVNGRQENRKNTVSLYNVLSYSGTNVAVNLATANFFWLLLTNDAYITAPSGGSGTNYAQPIQIVVSQNSTGGYHLGWDTAWYPTNRTPTMTTNANAVDVFSFVSSPFNTSLLGVSAQNLR
jgi:hypothetical protein